MRKVTKAQVKYIIAEALDPEGVEPMDYDVQADLLDMYSDAFKDMYGMRPGPDEIEWMMSQPLSKLRDEVNRLTSDLTADAELERASIDPLGQLEPDEYYDPREEMPAHRSMRRKGRRQHESSLRAFVRETLRRG